MLGGVGGEVCCWGVEARWGRGCGSGRGLPLPPGQLPRAGADCPIRAPAVHIRQAQPQVPEATHNVITEKETSTSSHDGHGDDVAGEATIVLCRIGTNAAGNSPASHATFRSRQTKLGRCGSLSSV